MMILSSSFTLERQQGVDRHAPVCLCGCVCEPLVEKEEKEEEEGGSLKGIDRWQRSGTQSRWPTISLSLSAPGLNDAAGIRQCLYQHVWPFPLFFSFPTRPSFTKRNGQVLNDKWFDWLLKYVSSLRWMDTVLDTKYKSWGRGNNVSGNGNPSSRMWVCVRARAESHLSQVCRTVQQSCSS